ncbi:MAG: acylhydrolase [Lachnospiraceae bacterium]|nr:acylhydrolase [Lachnospiraceae bacterium]
MKRIVCFGDSNTWGYNAIDGSRFSEDVRWTGLLQSKLGAGYKVIEEGQNGRSIVNADPWEWGTKAGIDYVIPMIESHMPFDLLIIMLGSNDLKAKFGLPAGDIAGSLQNMLLKVKAHLDYHLHCPALKILIVAPPLLGDDIANSGFAPFVRVPEVLQVSRELASYYKAVADQFGCAFLDASAIVRGCDVDSLHLDPEGHKILADALYEKVIEILK